MSKAQKNAISPTRSEDFPEWYQQVIKASEMAENSVVRGCMVIRPWGYGIWENLQRELDERIKATGHENAYFPLFIPLSFLEKEAEHVEGFAKECAIVTHHRLEQKDGKLIPSGELEEPLIVRPTSETIIGESFSKWVQSYRDLPLLINQWANVVRWEMRPRMFLRTAEFLWQEGHTAHSSDKEAQEEVDRMLEVYRELAEDVLCIPVIRGEKTAGERFPGAVNTLTIEAMMQDRKALQAGTSHYLGQNFAKASQIRFLNTAGELEYAYTTSWGLSTRMVGGMIMTHSDDDGLRVPPRVAPRHVVILPVTPADDTRASVLEACDKLAAQLRDQHFNGRPIVAHVDRRDIRGGEKSWQWIKKGVPLRFELGPKDLEKDQVVVYQRSRDPKDRQFLSREEAVRQAPAMLNDIHNTYFEQALSYRQHNTTSDIDNFDDLRAFFTPQNSQKPEVHGGFVRGKWCEDTAVEKSLGDLKVSIRCMPLEYDRSPGKCIITGRPAVREAIFAKAY